MESSLVRQVAVVIPARNEEKSLPLVLRDISRGVRTIVVDNGSTDATAKVAMSGGAVVVHEQRQGYESACLADLDYLATGSDRDAPTVIAFLDADYRDYPE